MKVENTEYKVEMTFNLLISCMHQKDASILQRSNVQSDVVVVNQCDHDSVEEFDFINKNGKTCHCKFINTTERGISRSRNMAIRNSWGSYCLIADDDELFSDDYEAVITKSFEDTRSDIIAFGFHYANRSRNNFKVRTKINWLNFMKICSVQIAFNRDIIMKNNISFAINMGSGSGNGGGEENKFISDCLRKHLIIIAEPSDIAEINYDSSGSLWFKGYDKEFCINKGWAIKQSIGILGGLSFSLFFCLKHIRMIRNDINPFRALLYLVKGVFSNKE